MARVQEPGSEARERLVDAGTRLLASEGPEALTSRRLSSEVGTSTMAIYTHFGGMDRLRRAIRDRGFERLARAWEAVDETSDPVADLTVAGVDYVAFAAQNANLYRAMFFEVSLDEPEVSLRAAGVGADLVGRCIEAGRFAGPDRWDLMWQLWTATHGAVAGLLAGLVPQELVAERVLALAETMYVGFGDRRSSAQASIAAARSRAAFAGPQPVG